MFSPLTRLLPVLSLTTVITIALKAQPTTRNISLKMIGQQSNAIAPQNDPLEIAYSPVVRSGSEVAPEKIPRSNLNPDVNFNSDVLHFQKSLSIKKTLPKSAALGRALIAPVLLTAAGLSTLEEDNDDNYELQQERNRHIPNFHHRADDYLQHAPIIAVYGLNWLGVEGKNDFVNRTAILIKSELVVGILTYSLKRITAVPRPDTKDLSSFPSGHTAQAFAAATFMAKEYGHQSIWYSIGAYTVATGVGAMRVMNNRHWASDVLVGAGIGILSTNLVYLTHQYRWGKKNKDRQTSVIPFYDGQTGMVSVVHRLR